MNREIVESLVLIVLFALTSGTVLGIGLLAAWALG